MTRIECAELFARLSEYLDEELPPDLCDRITDHINGCPPCVDFVESLRSSIGLCRGLDGGAAEPLPPAIKQELLSLYRRSCG